MFGNPPVADFGESGVRCHPSEPRERLDTFGRSGEGIGTHLLFVTLHRLHLLVDELGNIHEVTRRKTPTQTVGRLLRASEDFKGKDGMDGGVGE